MVGRTIRVSGAVLAACLCAAGTLGQATGPTPEESLAAVTRTAPVLAEAIRRDTDLASEVGAEKWPRATAQLARFVQSKDPDCQEALRIIGDTVPHTKSPVGKIALDGDPAEWAAALPPPEYARIHSASEDRLQEERSGGVAAVVRDGRLYLMVGLDAAYFEDPEHAIRLTLDCIDGPPWDVRLSVTRSQGQWRCTWAEYGSTHAKVMTPAGLTGAVGKATELAFDIHNFAPADKAKPIWTLAVSARHKSGTSEKWTAGRYLPVFNESARPGVAAGPYVRTFLMLCADATLEESDRTAAAIAIMSAMMYQCGNAEVQRQLRTDNAAFLALAREINQWQADQKTPYRLKDYPLEAQFAWAYRTPRNRQFFQLGRDLKHSLNDRENYYWSSTGVETLRDLRTLAVKEHLAKASLAETAKCIDGWVLLRQSYTRAPESLERELNRTEDPKEEEQLEKRIATAEERQKNADIVGMFHGEPLSEFRLSHTATLLAQIRNRGRTVGTCSHHAFFCQDLMRALGIAPLAFGVEPSRSDKVNHTWPAYYDPQDHRWRSHQAGRTSEEWWYFYVVRVPVYTYAAVTPHISFTKDYLGPRPLPFIFSRELQGSQVQELAQKGIEEATVREWMLAPGVR